MSAKEVHRNRPCVAPGIEAVVLEMIVHHAAPRDILAELCRRTDGIPAQRQVAFYLLERGEWELAATSELLSSSQAILAALDPENISLALFQINPAQADEAGASFGSFWCRHLSSGMGELLGLFVYFTRDCEPATPGSEKFAVFCRMAILAIEQRNLLEEMTWQADHDTITGLWRRTAFEQILAARLDDLADHDLADPIEESGGTLSLLCINIDRFRLVNSVLGHGLGNLVLKCVGSRFQSCLSGANALARIGGDEFALLTTAADPAVLAEELLQQLEEPFTIDEHMLHIRVSIGFCTGRKGITPESLQREAYIALYHAKKSRKGNWTRFDPSMAAVSPERLEMEYCLRSALQNHEMKLFYQPQIELKSGAVVGAEALRWKPEGLGDISPAAFIPILEETGLIVEFGHWVLEEACRQGSEWLNLEGLALRIGVNVSAPQFLRAGFAAEVRDILKATGFPPKLLELELTESIFIGDFSLAGDVFGELREMGVLVAIDDFGTGQSSLSYMQKLPFSRLKIDRAFVMVLGEPGRSSHLVGNILRMARDLGLTTVAEGIDRPLQVEILRDLGCDEGQGFFYSKALPAADFLAEWRHRAVSLAVV